MSQNISREYCESLRSYHSFYSGKPVFYVCIGMQLLQRYNIASQEEVCDLIWLVHYVGILMGYRYQFRVAYKH